MRSPSPSRPLALTHEREGSAVAKTSPFAAKKNIEADLSKVKRVRLRDPKVWTRAALVWTLLILVLWRTLAERGLLPPFLYTHRPRAEVVSVFYWALVVGFGIWVIRRNSNSYLRWRIMVLILCQTVFGLMMPLRILGHELPIKYPHLTWPLHMGVLEPGKGAILLVWGALTSLILWPAVSFYYGKGIYCGWFCSCGALAETAGDAFRLKAPRSPFSQKANLGMYLILVVAIATTLSEWAHVGLLRTWYSCIVGFLMAEVIGLATYPILGGRTWCRYMCPLAAVLGWFSQRGKSGIATSLTECIECHLCTRICEMGIPVSAYALDGILMKHDQCVACGECIAVCPTNTLAFVFDALTGLGPQPKLESLTEAIKHGS